MRARAIIAIILSPLTACSWTVAQSTSLIDALVTKKLQRLNLPLSPTCTDGDFIRRAYLDACGILPTAEETEKFLNEGRMEEWKDGRTAPSSNLPSFQSSIRARREKLIDALLARDEFVDYWTYKWCDLLLVSSRKLNKQAMWSFYNFIRDSVKQNKPWDVFTREIITATGSNLENGAANYFVIHKETLELTETTTQEIGRAHV